MIGLKKLRLTQKLMILAACGNAALATGVVVNTAPATAQVANSTYPSSCRNININGNLLTARCLRSNLTSQNTFVRVRGIQNSNGTLVSTGTQADQPSTYQNSCRNEQIFGATLVALCTRVDGSEQRTSIILPGIENRNGNLRY